MGATSETARDESDGLELAICCCLVLLFVFFVIGLFGIFEWLSRRPYNPDFIISNANFPVQNNSAMIFDLELSNPNDFTGVYYNVINFELVGTDGDVVGTNITPGFHQGYKNVTLKIVINTGQEFWQAGDVDFMVRIKTDVKFRVKGWTRKPHRVTYEQRFRYVNNKNS